MWNAIATYNLEIGKHRRGDAMVGIELNREDDSWFSGYKEEFAILNTDFMWPDAGVGTAQAYGRVKDIRWCHFRQVELYV